MGPCLGGKMSFWEFVGVGDDRVGNWWVGNCLCEILSFGKLWGWKMSCGKLFSGIWRVGNFRVGYCRWEMAVVRKCPVANCQFTITIILIVMNNHHPYKHFAMKYQWIEIHLKAVKSHVRSQQQNRQFTLFRGGLTTSYSRGGCKFQGVKYFNGPNYHDFNRIIMTFSIILSGIWGKKYRFEKVYIYILKYPRLVNVEYALKYKASTGYLILLYSLTTYLLTCLHTSLFTEVQDVSSSQEWCKMIVYFG